MESQTKRALIATAACLVVLVGWLKLSEIWYPPAKPEAAPTTTEPVAAETPKEVAAATSGPGVSHEAKVSGEAFAADSDSKAGPIILGDDHFIDPNAPPGKDYEFAVTLSPHAASVESIRLARFRNHVPKDPKHPEHDPYDLVQPIAVGDDARCASFDVLKAFLVEDKQTIDLSSVNWTAQKSAEVDTESAVFKTTIRKDHQPVIALVKTYRLAKGSHHLEQSLQIENLTRESRRVIITQRGPIGFKNEDVQRDSRRVASALVALENDERGNLKIPPAGMPLPMSDGPHPMRQEVVKADGSLELAIGDKKLFWAAIGNKYFGCIVTWLPIESGKLPFGEFVAKTISRVYLPEDTLIAQDLTRISDLSFEQALATEAIGPGKSVTLRAETYCGPKDDQVFGNLPVQYKVREYPRVSDPDRTGCTFSFIPTLMLWLLNNLHKILGNYGLAIIGLVFIVRLVLHPITKGGQVRMMKMQKRMAEIKPKIDALQEQYKNDKSKLNEETMKLYREYGVNPASSMLGCLPMMLQLPIWAGLWLSLNTNVHLRQQPFFWWIKDLSVPDGLWTPPPPWTLNIPVIGMITGPIHGFNLLPIIMAITMYAQQKFMQKITKPAVPPPQKLDAEGRPIADPMQQQQKMMNFMMIFFGAMFYNMPAGLNIYILCSNLLGMAEQYRIKKHIKDQEDQGAFVVKKPDEPRGPSWIEKLQDRAEDIRRAQGSGQRPKKAKKQPRF
ncbi:MAG TPA: membrane protein insertase YidC [Phycisphaerae bacterium]|nr:membrane protein insertase YidC [Phycisphaerae bacterium]